MEIYKNLDWDSWIIEYKISETYINIKFKTWKAYKFSYESAWKKNIENMKKLAVIWDWLNSYINRKCKKLFVK